MAGTCPNDGARLQINKHVSSDSALMRASCPACGQKVATDREDDPKAPEFRPWTDAERAGLVQHLLRGRSLVCPVDGAPLLERHHGDAVKIICERCDASHFHQAGEGV